MAAELDDDVEKTTTQTLVDDLELTTRLDDEKEHAAVPAGLSATRVPNSPYLVLAFAKTPEHPDDPLCRSKASKASLTLLAALLVMISAITSSCSSGAAPFIQAALGGNTALPLSLYLLGYSAGPFVVAPLSEAYGRRPLFIAGLILFTAFTGGCAAAPSYGALLVLRFCAGFAGAVPMTNSGAVCGDIWAPKERGTAMSFYSVATFSGPALGPIIASFAADRISWHWAFIIPTIIGGVLCVAVILACPETYPPVILSRVARQLRQETGDDRIFSALELAEMASRAKPRVERAKAEAYRLFAMPFVLLFTEIIVALITAYMSVVYGLIYLLFEGYPVIFSEMHHLGPGYSSLPFLSTFVGAVIAVPISLLYQKRYILAVKEAGKHEPEMRLPPAQIGGILFVCAFLWLGWGGNSARTPWIVPTLSGILQGIGSVLIFRALQTFLIDAYERYAASALASQVVVRSITGAVCPLFTPAMFHRLGPGWACTVLAAVMLILVPVPFVFERYGAQLRRNSKFAPGR
ncbi:hypothetical protein JCM1841_004906 [Sporobolomyces salmonicolor]